MKEKVKNYLFCLCALAMCLMFALAVFFKSCNSVKAAVSEPPLTPCIVETPNSVLYCGDITYNMGQSLGATTTEGSYIGYLTYNGSAFSFVYHKTGINVNTTYINLLTACNVSSTAVGEVVLTCAYGSYTSLTSSRTTAISNFVSPTITITRGDSTTNYNDKMIISNFPYTNGPANLSNVVFSSNGLSYSDGYYSGYSNARLEVVNELYYYSCLQNANNNTICPTSKYTRSELIQLSNQQIVLDILSIGGNGGNVPVVVLDYLKQKYNTTYNQCFSVSSSCSTWSSNELSVSNINSGLDIITENLNTYSENTYYNNGYSQGRTDGIQVGVEEGKTIGYSQGFIAGQEAEDIVGNAVLSVASTPLMILSGMLNFNIFGFNVLGLVLGLFTFVLVLWILKKVF